VQGHGSRHDEDQSGIPLPEEIEKTDDLFRLGHAGDPKPDREEKTNHEGRADLRPRNRRRRMTAVARRHDHTPNQRMTATVAMPAPINVSVAAIERIEKRLIPQTP